MEVEESTKGKKIWRKVIAIVAALLVFLAFVYFLCGNYLTDERINGFTGLNAIIRMWFDDEYVKLNDQPLQYLIPGGEHEKFAEEYFDIKDPTTYDEEHLVEISGTKDGVHYSFTFSVFTRTYLIATRHSGAMPSE